MKLLGRKILRFLKKPWIIFLILILAVISAGAYFIYGKEEELPYDFAVAQRGNVVQEVSVTGRVKPADDVDLAFEGIGRVSSIGVNVGDKVKAGQVIARLDTSELAAQLAEAQTNVVYQMAKLDELQKGTRPEQIQIAEVKVNNAEIYLEDAKKDLADKIKDAYTKSDDAVRNKTDQIFSNPRTSNPQIKFAVNDYQLEIDIEYGRVIAEAALVSWNSWVRSLISQSGDLNLYSEKTESNLDQIQSFLNKAGLLVNGLTADASLSQTIIDGYRSDIYTARSNLNTAIVNLSTSREKVRTAESALRVAENELILSKAGSVPEQIAAQGAQVKQAEAKVQLIQSQIQKNILRSPINGIVTKKEVYAGEIVSANQNAVSVMSNAKFELEANIPEADISKIKIGNVAKVSLDAYGSEIFFEAKVVKIEPAETIVEGVATYKTALQFIQEDERVKSGMTANIDILANGRDSVIFIPQRAIVGSNGDRKVKILQGGEIKEVPVKAGLRGSDGNTEILEGIKEGDQVVVFIKGE